MAVFNFIAVSVEQGVTTILFNRPEVLNAINPEMQDELQQAFDDFASDPAQRIGVITGAGDRAFCVGSDLKSPSAFGQYPAGGYGGIASRFGMNKPLIAAVNGLALGGGFEIALACDIIIATENARFGLPEPKVGAIAVGGGIHRLVRQIGLKSAMGILLSGRTVESAEALRLGLVNQVVPTADLSPVVQRWCADILRCSPAAVVATKALAQQGLEAGSVEAAMSVQSDCPEYTAWLDSLDRAEGRRAFAERRPPNWILKQSCGKSAQRPSSIKRTNPSSNVRD